ncbi:hypothetical protein BDN71DRAFT_1535020 [Pleurotus eryngii]|uniref:Uncharacterized protein n=1 Tax=Pleurotus eryngii TaxID=5323 RepID=A0A9P6DAE2_PLEER|nr:hypothetical protein BDN71DRAFT_1535020 [Pleurotus eryngii]
MILKCASMHLIMTSTSLQTFTRDLAAMGHLINVAWFSTDVAYKQEQDDLNTIRRLSGKKFVKQDVLQAVRVQISTHIKNRSQGKIICCSPRMIGKDGKPLVSLPAKRHIILEIEPTMQEREIFKINANTEKDDLSGSDGKLLVMNKGFYIPH